MENFQAEGRTQYRLFEYDFIRVVAMVFVIAVHALVVIDFADKFSLFYFNVMQAVFFSCNGIFFMISGRFALTSRVNPKFCVNAKLRCKIEQKCFKAGAAQAAAAFSTKITALRGDVKGGGVSLRSSRLLTFRLQPVSPACGRQRTPLTVRELRSSPAAFRSTSS